MMKLVCAWCGVGMERSGYDQTPEGTTSHGLCRECSLALASQDEGTTLQRHIDSIPTPILLIDSENKVLAANARACEILGSRSDTANVTFGPVFDCVYSRSPEGCGRAIHCVGCVIRKSVAATFNTGQPQVSVPATLSVNSPDQPSAVTFTITTIRTGECVTLRIDQLQKDLA
jgi:hypothetical protein